jgi:GSH-dependent disulfide-bond oxidoreductase
MITLYTQTTPNGRKPLILLAEIDQPYDLKWVNFGAQEQKSPAFLALNPNGKIPVLVDSDGAGGSEHLVFESGAILIYLAQKFASPLWPASEAARSICLQWLMFQMASVGPMIGQMGHFKRAAPQPQDYATARFGEEVTRILGVLETRLVQADYLAGDYSIADIATYPWIIGGRDMLGLDLAPFPALAAWIDRIGTREAVKAAMAIEAS